MNDVLTMEKASAAVTDHTVVTKAGRIANGSAIEIEKLSVSYGEVQAVRGVSFQVRQGEIFGLLGPNGAGKTTTLSAIEGLVKPKSGRVTVLGMDVQRQ